MSEQLKTCALFPAWCMEFADGKDNPEQDCSVLTEVTDVADSGEREIAFSLGKRRFYLRFRQKDLLRAIKEMQ